MADRPTSRTVALRLLRSPWSWRSAAFRGLLYQVIALAAGRRRGLVPRPQHAREHARARHPERLRLPDAAGRLRHRREPDRRSTRPSRYGKAFLVGLSNTLRVAHRRHRPGDDRSARCSASAASRATPSCARSATRYVELLPQRPAPAAAAHLVLRAHRGAAADRRGAAAAARASSSARTACSSRSRCGRRVTSGMVVGLARRHASASWCWATLRAARGSRPPATRRRMFRARAGDRHRLAAVARLARSAARRRRSTLPEKTEITVVGGGARRRRSSSRCCSA